MSNSLLDIGPNSLINWARFHHAPERETWQSLRFSDLLSTVSFGISPATINKKPSLGELSTFQALRCLHDRARTCGFVTATHTAIQMLEKIIPRDREIIVIDAGCGPIPILGVTAAKASPRAKVFCIEANDHSAELATLYIQKHNLSDQVSVIKADATIYQLKHPQGKADLLVTETMNQGLLDESIVPIIRNFAGQLSTHGLVVPERVTVELELTNGTSKIILPLYELTKINHPKNISKTFDLSEKELPHGEYRINLLTSVTLLSRQRASGTIYKLTLPHEESEITKKYCEYTKILIGGEFAKRKLEVNFEPCAQGFNNLSVRIYAVK